MAQIQNPRLDGIGVGQILPHRKLDADQQKVSDRVARQLHVTLVHEPITVHQGQFIQTEQLRLLEEHHARRCHGPANDGLRSEEHTSELQSLMRISYAVFSLKKKKK